MQSRRVSVSTCLSRITTTAVQRTERLRQVVERCNDQAYDRKLREMNGLATALELLATRVIVRTQSV